MSERWRWAVAAALLGTAELLTVLASGRGRAPGHGVSRMVRLADRAMDLGETETTEG